MKRPKRKPVNTCDNCGRAIRKVRPRGAMYENDRIWVHIDDYRAFCGFRDEDGNLLWTQPSAWARP